MSEFVVIKRVSSDQLQAWRTEAIAKARADPRNHAYARTELRAPKHPMVANQQGDTAVLSPPPALPSRRRPAHEVRDALIERKVVGIGRLMAMNPEAKRDIIAHLRLTRPGLFGPMTDDEAYRRFDELMSREAEATTQRVFTKLRRNTATIGAGS